MRHGYDVISLVVGLLASSSPTLAQLPLGSEFQVNTYTTGQQLDAAVAMDTDGDFVVVWESRDQIGNSGDIFGQRYAGDGSPLGVEFLVNTYTSSSQIWPDLALSGNGDFVVVWSSRYQAGNVFSVFGQRFDSAGSPLGAEFQVNTHTSWLQFAPSVAADADGKFVVVWESLNQDGDDLGIFGQRFDAAGRPLGGEFQVNTLTAATQFRADVAADADGDFVVIWRSDHSARSAVLGQRFDAEGQPAGAEFEVSPSPAYDQRAPALAMDADGNFVIVWERLVWRHPIPHLVFGRRYDASGNTLGASFQVSSSANTYPRQPAIGSDADGNFIVTWLDVQDGGHIFAKEYDPDGTPRTAEFRVNTHVSGAHVYPAVAADADGDFVVAWQSLNQDGSYGGIFGQRFAGPGLHLSANGSCPGPVTVTLAQAPPSSEVAVIAAANNNGFTKGGTLCPGTQLEIGEPFSLPPTLVIVDDEGNGTAGLNLPAASCWLEALALATCETSGAVQVP